jgi:hypothetical protein
MRNSTRRSDFMFTAPEPKADVLKKGHPLTRSIRTDASAAETIAARALGFLAADHERLGRFLALSGLDPRSVREAARSPGFLPAVLDHLLADERLLSGFAEAEGLSPAAIVEARSTLGGRVEE